MNELLTDVENIIKNQEWENSTKSDKIMERLRGETIFLRDQYFHSFNDADTVTIDPTSEYVKHKLEELEDYVKIYANSFGPFNPKEYFKKDFRILWLLKEPYMESGDLDKYNRGEYRYLGGHDQAEESVRYFKQKREFGNHTLDNLLRISRDVLLSCGKIHPEALYEEVMNHICILEANHFPGLAFNGTKSSDDSIGKWMTYNKDLLTALINFYDGKLLFGHYNCLSGLCNGSNQVESHLFNFLKTHSYSELIATDGSGYPATTLLGCDIINSGNKEIEYTRKDGKQKSKYVSMLTDNAERNWYACPHLSNGVWKNEEFNQKFAAWISETLKKKTRVINRREYRHSGRDYACVVRRDIVRSSRRIEPSHPQPLRSLKLNEIRPSPLRRPPDWGPA